MNPTGVKVMRGSGELSTVGEILAHNTELETKARELDNLKQGLAGLISWAMANGNRKITTLSLSRLLAQAEEEGTLHGV